MGWPAMLPIGSQKPSGSGGKLLGLSVWSGIFRTTSSAPLVLIAYTSISSRAASVTAATLGTIGMWAFGMAPAGSVKTGFSAWGGVGGVGVGKIVTLVPVAGCVTRVGPWGSPGAATAGLTPEVATSMPHATRLGTRLFRR